MEERRAYLWEQGREDREGQRTAGAQQQPGAEGIGRREHSSSTCTARAGAGERAPGRTAGGGSRAAARRRRGAAGGSRAESRARRGEERTAEATDRRGGGADVCWAGPSWLSVAR